MNIVEYFDQTQIINLASRTDRRREVKAEFKKNNFSINSDKVSFFDAITSEESDDFECNKVKGCFLSHLDILKNAKKLKLKNILILEDDIVFTSYINKYSQRALWQLAKLDWDIVYFGHGRGNGAVHPEWNRVDMPILQTHFYAINGKILHKIIPFMEDILEREAGHPDGETMQYHEALNTFFTQHPETNAFYFSKNLGHQRPSRTDLHKISLWDTSAALKPFAETYKKLKGAYLKSIS